MESIREVEAYLSKQVVVDKSVTAILQKCKNVAVKDVTNHQRLIAYLVTGRIGEPAENAVEK